MDQHVHWFRKNLTLAVKRDAHACFSSGFDTLHSLRKIPRWRTFLTRIPSLRPARSLQRVRWQSIGVGVLSAGMNCIMKNANYAARAAIIS